MGLYDKYDPFSGVDVDTDQLHRQLTAMETSIAARPEPIASRSTLGEMGAGFKRGLFVAVPEMAGGAIKSIAGVDSDWYKKGQDLQESAQAIAKLPEFQKSTTAEDGLVNKVLVSGAEGVGQMAPIIATGALNPYAGAALAAGMYGGSTYQDTKERMLKQEGLDDRFAAANPDDPRVVKAKNTGLTSGAIQGLGEGAMTLVGGKFVKAALPTIGKATVESILGKTAKPGLAALKEYAKGMGLELAGETITEPLQDETQAAIERSAGLKDAPRFMEQAAGSAQGGFGTALLLAPFGIPAHVAKYSRSAAVQSALTDPAADPAARVAAAQLVAQDLQKVDPDAATNFLDHAVDAIGDEATTGSAPYALDLSDSALLLPKQSATVADNAQQVSALPGQQADTTTGTAGASPAPGGADFMGDIPEFGSPAIARDGAVPPIAGGNQYQQFADAPFTNAPAQPAIAGPAVEGMLGNLKPVAADGSKNSLASALLAGGNPYQRFADTPFVNAPVQPAIAGAGVEGMLGVLQPAPSSPRYQAMQWAEQQMQDPATSKFDRQNLNALIKAADPEKKDLVKYWASSTGQRKQPVATIAGVPTQQQGVAVNDSQSGKTTQVVMPGEFGQPASQAPTAVVSQPLTSNPVLSQKTGNMNVKRDRSVKPASDDMITAIAKLGGLNQDQAIAQWGNAIKDSKKDLARHATKNGKAGFLHVISKTGKNLDEMREALEEQGYLQPGSSIEDMYARIDQHLGGRPTYSNQNQQQVEDQDLSQAPDGVDESDYPFDLSGINFPEKERKRLKFLKQMLNNARNEKTKAQAKKALQRFMIDQSANQAATSPQNNLSEPTQAQIEAGNYKKGHVLLHGLDISIENPAGSLRKGVDESGKQWQTKIAHHYGYIKGTVGKDKDHIDIFIGPQQDSRKLFVVDQKNIKTGAFDEHKIMAGFNSREEARAGYLANYDKTGPDRIGAITETTIDQFKQWLKDGDTKQQFSEDTSGRTLAQDTKTGESDTEQQYLDSVSKRFEEKFKDAIFEIDEDQQKQNLQEGRYAVDRLPQEAEQAVLKGKLGAAASVAARSSGTDIADAGQGKTAGEAASQVKQNQAKALTTWAKEHDLLIDAAEFNSQWSVDKIHGAEHDVYFTNDNRVIKRLTPTFTSWSDYFNRVALHNYLFPDTAYTLSGFMLDNGKLFAVVEQPFIKQHESQPVTDADIFTDTEQMGFTHKPSKGMTGDEARAQDFYHADGMVMTDLHDANVFRNYAGSLRYIDAIIWMDYATKYQRLAERYGIGQATDIEVDVDLPTTRNTAKHKAFLQRMLKNAKTQAARDRIQKGLAKLEARTKPTAPTPATSGPANTSENNAQSGPVPMLLGEKIGGARKDLESSGTSSKPKKPVSNIPAWKRRYAIAEVANRDSQNFGKWSIRDTSTDRPLVRKYFDTLKEAEQFLPMAVFAVKHRVQLDSDGTWKIVRNVTDRKRVTLKDGFESEEAANRYVIEHTTELIEQNTYFGEEIIARPETVLREGPQYRDGNATATMFMDTFGFRSAEFGNWNNEAERQEILNHAFDSLMDMADILNIPPKAVSLNGELAIAFGARGQGLSGAAAHYEPGYAVFNLTKMAGAGKLFHEWLHAMDNYFARQDGRAKSEKELNKRGDLVYPAKKEDMVSDGFSRKGSGVRQEVQDAFLNLMEIIWYKTEQYVEDADKAQRFVQSALDNVNNQLADIRRNIATERRYGAKKKPATAEQLQRFDALAAKLQDPAGDPVEWRYGIGIDPNQPVKRGNMGQNRWTNDALEELSALVKEVTGRSGFNAEGHGEINYLASRVRDLHNRNSMLQEAKNRDTKTKKLPTSFRQEAYKIDQGRSSDYWTDKWEMLARAGSAYMEDKLQSQDRRNDFLSFGSDNKYYRLFNIRPFPEGQERESINKAFDSLFNTLKTKETDKGVALYSANEEAGSLFTSGLDSDTITEKPVSKIIGITPVSAKALRDRGLQPVEVQGETSDMLRAVAGRFGLKAIFYRTQQLDATGNGGKQTVADRPHSADGFITGADKNTIFLNVNSGRHLQFILGHEISHALDLNNAKAYQQLLVDLYPYLNKEKVAEYEDYLKTNPVYKDIDTFGTYKEVVADAMGELFVAPNAWSTLATEKPTLFSKLADAIIKVLNKIKSLFTNELKPATFFTDYARVNRILLNAIKDYAENNGGTDGLTDTTKEYYAAAWHGSPHDHDKFSTDKIGTGEGAQAYGYGLYFAGNKEVAEWYREQLSDISKVNPNNEAEEIVLDQFKKATKELEAIPALNDMKDWLSRDIDGVDAWTLQDAAEELYKRAQGRLYKVELAPAEDEYLLWDKPLSEQSEKVKTALKDELEFLEFDYSDSPANPLKMSGAEFYRGLPKESDRATSEYLHSLGIRGIKYLDGTSRNNGHSVTRIWENEKHPERPQWRVSSQNGYTQSFMTEKEAVADAEEKNRGRNNYNYVIFNDADVTIEEKYSLTSPVGTGLKAADLQKEFDAIPFKSRIKVVQSADELPGFGSKSLFSKMVEGQYKNGTIYLVADNLPDIERAKVVALGHELAHAGQSEKLTDLAAAWFRDALAKGANGSKFQQATLKILKQEAAKRGYKLTDPADFRKAVQEATAVIAETAYRTGDKAGLMTKLLMYIKHFLRNKLGIKLDYSDKELVATVLEMMRQGAKNLTNGNGPDGGQFAAATPQFSLASPTDAARDRQLADHLQKQKFGEKTAVMVRSLFDLLESALPPKLKANMGKILNNPWWGSEGNPIRRAIVNLNLNRSHVRNALLFEVMQADGKEYEGIEGLEALLNKGSKQDKALWNKIIKQGDIDEKWYTDAELKAQGANKLVIQGYRQFHKIVNKINQIRFRELKDIALLPYKNESWFDDLKAIIDLRDKLDQGLDPAQKAILTKLLQSLKDNPDLGKLAKKQPEVVAAYKEFIKQLKATSDPHLVRMAYRHINDYHTEIDKIRNEWGFVKGYAPRMRKDGDWHVSVYKVGESDGAETRTKVYMKPVNTELGATRLIEQIKRDMAGHLKSNYNKSEQYVFDYKRDTSEPGELLSDRASNLALESLVNSALEDSGIFKSKDVDVAAIKRAIKEELAHKIMAQGFSRHGIKREEYLIEGYRDDDYLAVLKEFGAGQSGWLSKIRYATEVTREADGIAQANPDDKVWVHNYYKDSMRNSTYLDEIAATARSVGAVYYLGFKFSSALLNGFQNYTLGQAELSSMMKKAGKKGEPVLILTKAMGDVLRSNLSDEEKLVLDKAIREGTLHAQAVRAMSGLQEQGFGGKWKKFAETAMTPFSWVEQHVNREPAMLAAYRVFRDKATPAGQIDAAAFAKAEEFVNNTQFLMGNENLPELVRMLGPVGKTAYLFQGYVHNYLLWLAKRGRAGEFEAIARSFGAIALLGGAFALPGGDDLDKWIEKWFGVSYKLKAKQWINRQTKEYGWAGYKLEGFINHGLPAVFGVDMSRAIAVNLPFMSDTEKSFGERIGGVWSGLAKKPGMAASALQSGDYLRAVENLVPEFVANPMRAARQYSQGATTLAGKPIFDETGRQMKYGATDLAKKALGFNPLEVSEQTELRGHARSLKAHWTDKRDDALAQIRKADNGTQIREIMQTFNRDLKKSQAYGPVGLITLESVHRARNVKPNKKQLQWQQANG